MTVSNVWIPRTIDDCIFQDDEGDIMPIDAADLEALEQQSDFEQRMGTPPHLCAMPDRAAARAAGLDVPRAGPVSSAVSQVAGLWTGGEIGHGSIMAARDRVEGRVSHGRAPGIVGAADFAKK